MRRGLGLNREGVGMKEIGRSRRERRVDGRDNLPIDARKSGVDGSTAIHTF